MGVESLATMVAVHGVEDLLSRGLLLVDDEPDVIAVLREFFLDDYVVHVASSGPEALRIAASVPLDVVVTDHRMPEMTGVELLEKMLVLRPDVAGIVLTAHADLPSLLSAINSARAFRFLRKPFESAEVVSAVAQASEHVYQRRALSRLLEVLSGRTRELSAALASLRSAQEQMLHLERLGTTGRLAAGIAHDLRNVMASFIFLESDLQQSGLDSEVLETVHVGMQGFMNLVTTLETLRGFSRGGQLDVKKEKIDAGAVVRDTVAIARMDGGYRERRVRVQGAEASLTFPGDRQKLTQVLVNLVRNAVQATTPGQSIAIEVSSPVPGEVLFAVEDEGAGVPSAVRDRLFAPFVSTKGEQGVGMGLYMAQLIVAGHQGTIRCVDRAGGGARFEVRLPCKFEIEHPV